MNIPKNKCKHHPENEQDYYVTFKGKSPSFRCKICVKNKAALYYSKNKEQFHEYYKNYYSEHRERIITRNKYYVARNRLKVNDYNREWRIKNGYQTKDKSFLLGAS